MPPPPRRHPLATAANHYAVNQHQQRAHHPQPPPLAPQPKQEVQTVKQAQELPLPRQNAKVTPPSPPKIIVDTTRSIEFMRVGMLGEVSRPSAYIFASIFPWYNEPLKFGAESGGP